MVEDVVISKRLLDHHQVVAIKRPKQPNVGKRVRRIGITHQQDVWKFRTHSVDDIQIPSRLDFNLYSLVSGCKFSRDLIDEHFYRILNTDRNAAADLFPYATEVF